jgi:hypothetical protein
VEKMATVFVCDDLSLEVVVLFICNELHLNNPIPFTLFTCFDDGKTHLSIINIAIM